MFLFTMLHAQKTALFSSNNPQWLYGYVYNGCVPVPPFNRIDGSFEANGKTYHRLYRVYIYENDNGSGTPYESPTYPVGVREESGKVYAYQKDYASVEKRLRDVEYFKTDVSPYLLTEDDEVILYDFTLKEGDTYPTSPEFGPIFVNSIEVIRTADGADRKLFTLSNGIKILEGVGCLNTDDVIFYLYDHHTFFEDGDGYYTLWSYTKDGNIIYHVDDYTDTLNDLRSIINKTPSNPSSLFDLQGRRLNAVPARGLYIKDGRKYVK
jgi:hypothetical protein